LRKVFFSLPFPRQPSCQHPPRHRHTDTDTYSGVKRNEEKEET
jgi:hypothetical protein